ncbi:hypothetical protein E3N88_35850 [Mikania micrantha]|uniref:Ubiquitin-like protease family profile domain-containing protein n=1 Tax=Mikania micrantha TaxID=192012 RepID=A0A5N6M220_9ASTR|nr:hypothetical protein E3N88_35850 [Mikania micrantha]
MVFRGIAIHDSRFTKETKETETRDSLKLDNQETRRSIADTTLIRVMIQHEEVSTLDPKIFGMTYRVGGVELKFGPKEFCLLSGFRFGKQTCDFNTFIPKPFAKVFATDCPQQKNSTDCGAWLCIFMDRLINNKVFYDPDEDTGKTASLFRLNFAKKCYENIVEEGKELPEKLSQIHPFCQ